jgi:DNA-directed RNA polymerase specialized sigma24 family protein
VLRLRFGAGLPHREIARLLGTSETNAAKVLHRALRKLRHQVAEDLASPV